MSCEWKSFDLPRFFFLITSVYVFGVAVFERHMHARCALGIVGVLCNFHLEGNIFLHLLSSLSGELRVD